MARSLPINKTAIQLTITILFYLILRIPLIDNALSHDEMYRTFSYLSSSPLVELQPEKEISKRFDWGRDWKRQIAYHPLFFLSFYYNWIRLFGDSERSLHIPVIIAGLVGIIILYFLGSLIFGNDISLMATLAAVFSGSHIMYSVQAVYAIFEMLIFLASLLVLSKFIITKNKRFFRVLLILNLLGISIFYHYFLYLIIQTIILWLLRDEFKVRLPYFFTAFLLIATFSVFVTFNYNRKLYLPREWWPRNDFKQTIKNIVNLPEAYIK